MNKIQYKNPFFRFCRLMTSSRHLSPTPLYGVSFVSRLQGLLEHFVSTATLQVSSQHTKCVSVNWVSQCRKDSLHLFESRPDIYVKFVQRTFSCRNCYRFSLLDQYMTSILTTIPLYLNYHLFSSARRVLEVYISVLHPHGDSSGLYHRPESQRPLLLLWL